MLESFRGIFSGHRVRPSDVHDLPLGGVDRDSSNVTRQESEPLAEYLTSGQCDREETGGREEEEEEEERGRGGSVGEDDRNVR